ncbi:hypothetical protein PU630_16920 [Microbacterium horticulturae]|uniref:DUF2262 domain-containing protein n=1 Tax=Microbacterium horticulturae TaxID=3028316 RepID=A0ABY8BYB9_9MICO|nr:hypothetical protein [Microbacterium sp. KACC 23027]WEG08900.1 hypothetical protein PU630_16920 [Microbacterium sp. KACC 23027]
MAALTDPLDAAGTMLHSTAVTDEFACWAAELPAGGSVSILTEPPSVPTSETLATAAGIIADFAALAEAAARYLVAELATPEWGLDAADLGRLSTDAFDVPEAVVWEDGTWMLRFAECDLQVGAEYGIGVNFVGTAPVGVEDLSDADEV